MARHFTRHFMLQSFTYGMLDATWWRAPQNILLEDISASQLERDKCSVPALPLAKSHCTVHNARITLVQ